MKKHRVSAETRDKTIRDADLGMGAWSLRTVRAVAAFRARRSGKVRTGEIAYRAGQAGIGLLAALLLKAAFGVPTNFLSGLVLACIVFGSQFGAVRFLFFSLIYWGVVGTGTGALLGAWPLSPSWWRAASDAFAGPQTGLWPIVGALILASVVWVAGGRLAAKGMGAAAVRAIEALTFQRSQEVQKRRSEEIEEEFAKVAVTRGEVDELSRRDEADRRRAVVFGGSTRRRRAEGVSLSKAQEPEARDPVESAQRVADLAGHVDDRDMGVLAGLTSGPAFDDMLGGVPTPPPVDITSRAALVSDVDDDIPGPSARAGAAADDDIPGPSARASLVADGDMPGPSARASLVVDDDDIPGPSARAVRASETGGTPASSAVVVDPVEKLDQPVPAVSAPRVNPEASRGRRRLSREDLSKMIDIFNFMSREDNLEVFVNSTRSKLIRLTDEDYEELRTLEGGDVLITMSQDLKIADQSNGRTAVSERRRQADDFMTGTTPKKAIDMSPDPSEAGSMLASALSLVHTAASGRASLGAPSGGRTPPPQSEKEDFSDVAETPATASSPATERQAVEQTPAEVVPPASPAADGDITENEDLDPNMRRLPTTYASERVSVLGNATLSDDQKLDRLKALDRSQSVSTMEMFAGDEVSGLLNLPSKVMISLREKVVHLMGERPSDMVALQSLYDRRVELVQRDLFDRPQDYQRVLTEFASIAAEVHAMALRIDSPQSRDLLDSSIRLDPWFEQNLEGMRSGRITSALPVPRGGPGVLDRFSGTVQAALRGAGMPAVRSAQPEPSMPASATSVGTTAAAPPAPRPSVTTDRAPFVKGVDSQWTSKETPGTDEYDSEMAEHFAMIVKRNTERVEQAERARLARIEQERREENERLARIALADKMRRESEFFASLPDVGAPRFVTALPARFMSQAILSEISSIVEGHGLSFRTRGENAAGKDRFVAVWTTAHGSPPDRIDELAAPGERFQIEIALRNGEHARRLFSRIAEECGLPGDAGRDEIAARLIDEDENEFARRIDGVVEEAAVARHTLDVAREREDAAIAAAVSRDMRQRPAVDGVSDGAAGPSAEALEIEALRQRANAAEAEARDARAAASDMKQKVEDLQARADGPATSPESPGHVVSVSEDVDGSASTQVGSFLAEHLQKLDVRLDVGAYTSRIQGGILVVVDVPDEMATANRVSMGGRQSALADVLARWVLRPAAAVHPDLDIAQIVLITDGALSSDVSDAGLGVSEHTLEICSRELVPIDRVLRSFGAVE